MKGKKNDKSRILPFRYLYVIDPQKMSSVFDLCLENGIEAEAEGVGTVCAVGKSAKAFESLLSSFGIPYEKKLKNRCLRSFFSVFSPVGTLLGAVIFFVFLPIINGVVFDVRAEGIPYFSEAEVLREAEAAGIYVGARWKKIDRDVAENQILLSSDRVGWVSITRKGCVAIVKVREKRERQPIERSEKTVNIIADCDAIIEEINVKSGYAVVMPGDVVRKGDLLISGVMPEALGGGLVAASGTVRGKVTESIEVFAENVGEEKNYGKEKTVSVSVNIFGKTLNIFKNSGNSDSDCVIMKEIKVPSAFGGAPLPIRIEREYRLPYVVKNSPRTEEEMMNVSAYRLMNELFFRFSDADILSVKTVGADVENGYRLTADVLVATEIGTEKEFFVK